MTASTQDIAGGGKNNSSNHSQPDSKKSGVQSTLSYVLLPGIIPQIKELGRGGFGYLAMLIATVYQAVRILPAGHPYTKYGNIGKFGIRQVIAAAANNVKLDKKNIDQVIIFFAVLAGILVLALQFISFIILLISGEAFAQTAPAAGMFTTANPQTDVAFHMMREVFGVPDLFGTIDGGQTTFHKALHVMFNFYNLAILVVAVFVFVYYVIVVVGETAQTGVPFGQRFSHIYAPFRLVIAIGLLVPLNHGLNGAQYITLNAAKIGSSFATSGWIAFNDSLAETNPLGAKNASLIAETRAPDFRGLVEFMAMAVTCKEAYANLSGGHKKEIKKYCSVPGPDGTEGTPVECSGPSAEGAVSVNNTENIKVTFGAYNSSEVPELIPYCGTAIVYKTVPTTSLPENGDPGALQKKYIAVLDRLWSEESELQPIAKHYVTKNNITKDTEGDKARQADKTQIFTTVKAEIDTLIKQHYDDARSQADFKIRDQTKKLGWGGAGVWYNRIAQINGAYVTATMGIPTGQLWPSVMETVKKYRSGQDGSFKACKAFDPNLADNKDPPFKEGDVEASLAQTFNAAYQFWTCDKRNTENIFLDSASALFGLNGLMSIRDTGTDADGNIIQVHPLAKLSALGKGLIEAAIRNMGIAVGSSFLGGMAGVLSPHLGAGLESASKMFVSIATIGLSMGFITYYILPFLPFIYFFFAVGGWVKSIFEAMVGAPLWALAHLRIDGDGLPGKMAMNGYFLIFEIFLRPILTLFGLIGGMAIFTALASMLNEVFDLVVFNAADGIDLGADVERSELSRHIVDIFFFTAVYAVILYMMAVASFKMINLVPNNILRWLGQSVSSFSDSTQDPTQGLTQYAAIGGARIGGQLAGGATELGKGGGAGIGGLGKFFLGNSGGTAK